jgi:uncharacterized membrane protein
MHQQALTSSPTDLSTTTVALFFTRWITHFCAPAFVFLAGTSAFLSSRRHGGPAQRRFLVSRGLWLMLLEFTVINFAIWWDIRFSVFLQQVIAAIGFGMIILGLLQGQSARVPGIAGIAIICLHGLAALVQFPPGSALPNLLTICFNGGLINLPGGRFLVVGYPLVPWLGILLTGYAAGSWFLESSENRFRRFRNTGFLMLLACLVLRATNIPADPAPWSLQPRPRFTMLSFLNLSKYPPSLLFCLLTLGVMFLLLAGAERLRGRLKDILQVYGKVPMGYYIAHWYLLHPLMFGMLWLQGFGLGDFRFGFSMGRPEAPSGLGLLGTYAVWITVVILLYPFSRWYGRYKAAHPEKKWLRYI